MIRWGLLVACLAGCASGAPGLATSRASIAVAPSSFVVHRRGDYVEAYRTSFEVRPSERAILLRAMRAIEGVTGCGIRAGSLRGDQAIVTAQLDCDASRPKPPVAQITLQIDLDCALVDHWQVTATHLGVTEIDCYIL